MNKMNKDWIKFLSEQKVRELIPREIENNPRIGEKDYLVEFEDNMKNPGFLRMLIPQIIKFGIIPLLKSLRPEQLSSIKKLVKDYPEMKEALDMWDEIRYDNQRIIYDIFRNKKNDVINEFFEKSLLFFFIHAIFYNNISKLFDPGLYKEFTYSLYESYNRLINLRGEKAIYQKPFIKRTPKDATSSRIAKNVSLIKQTLINRSLPYSEKVLKEFKQSKILSEFDIDKFLGAGAFGATFSIRGTNRVIKIFQDAYSLESDIKRINRVVEEIYEGTASIHDMHYFEYGMFVPGGSYHYAIMPKIIPLEETAIYKKYGETLISEILYSYYRPPLDRTRIIDNVVNRKCKTAEEKEQDTKTFTAMVNAAVRASDKWSGSDLHAGNIGVLLYRPDVFVFFDM